MSKLLKFTPPWRGKQKNRGGFTHTLILASLRSFFDIFRDKFNIFFAIKLREVSGQRNKKTMPRLVSGFTLVETLVAISIFTVSLLGIMSVLASSIANTNYAKRKMVATYLAQEGIEYIRNMRDSAVLDGNWTNGFTAKLASCKNRECGFNSSIIPKNHQTLQGCTGNSCVLTGDYSGFTRKVWRDDLPSSDEVKIYSKVEWTQGSGPQSVTFSENLFNWLE